MKRVSFLFQPRSSRKRIMSLCLLPQIIKLNQVTDGPRLNLTEKHNHLHRYIQHRSRHLQSFLYIHLVNSLNQCKWDKL